MVHHRLEFIWKNEKKQKHTSNQKISCKEKTAYHICEPLKKKLKKKTAPPGRFPSPSLSHIITLYKPPHIPLHPHILVLILQGELATIGKLLPHVCHGAMLGYDGGEGKDDFLLLCLKFVLLEVIKLSIYYIYFKNSTDKV